MNWKAKLYAELFLGCVWLLMAIGVIIRNFLDDGFENPLLYFLVFQALAGTNLNSVHIRFVEHK